MYVRDAKNREEVWLLDHIEEMGLDESMFRSRDYVVAVDESTGSKAGFGRIRVHRADGEEYCELTSIGVLPKWRGQGVGAHVVERLIEYARDEGFDLVYSFTEAPEYLTQFGFEPVSVESLPSGLGERLESIREDEPDAIPVVLNVDDFEMPDRFRRRFKDATPGDDDPEDDEPEETPEDFGIDPDEATYKYDV